MITKATKLSRLLVCVMLASVLLVSILPMQAFAAQETETSNEIDISAITLENLPEILKQEMDITPDYSSALGINTNTYSLRETTVLKTGLLASDAQRLDGLTLVNPDGTKTAYSFGADIKFIEDNAVKFVDNQIINKVSLENGRLFFYQTKDSDNMLYLPLNISSGLLFKNGDLSLTLAPASFSFSFAQLKEDENEYAVQYDNVFAKGISLEYLSVYGGFKENIIINEKNGINEFSYVLDIPGYKAELTDGGKRITVTSKEDGENAYVFGHPFAQDANGKITNDCDYTLKHLFGDRYILTLRADKQFLNDESTAYPVTVDPPLEVSRGSVEDATISSAGYFSSTDANLYVGIDQTLGHSAAYSRCNFLWYFRHLRPEDITDAYFHTASVNGISTTSYISLYDSQWSYSIDGMTYSDVERCQHECQSTVELSAVNSACDFEITQLMQKWLKHYLGESGGKNPNYGFFLNSNDNVVSLYSAESSHAIYPYFTITYNEQNIIPNGYYHIKNKQYDTLLSYSDDTDNVFVDGSSTDGTDTSFSCWYNWYIRKVEHTQYGENIYLIEPFNYENNKALGSENLDAYTNGINVQINDYSAGNNPNLWRIIKNADGTYRLMPAQSTMLSLTCDNTGSYNAYTYEYYGWQSMKWEFEALTTDEGAAWIWDNGDNIYETSEYINCCGYALNVLDENYIYMEYGDNVENIADKTMEFAEQYDITIYRIESYDAPIRENEYRIALRVGNYEDYSTSMNGYYRYMTNNIEYRSPSVQLKKGKKYASQYYTVEPTLDRFLSFDYHFMRQSIAYDDEGDKLVVWAEKHGQKSVDPETDVRVGNPSLLSWSNDDTFRAYSLIDNKYIPLGARDFYFNDNEYEISLYCRNPLIYPYMIEIDDVNNIIDHTNYYNSETVYFAVSIN